MELLARLRKREAEGKRIRAGIVGCGQMGSGMVHVTHQMPGMRIMVIADIDLERPRKTLAALGVPSNAICVTGKEGEAEDALKAGHYVLTQDAELPGRLEGLDAVVEATGSTEVGARVAWGCIEHRKHVIMLNVETDVTVGVLLRDKARKAGCVYSAAMGDEPGVCKTLYDHAVCLGFDVVCVGKGKNNLVDLHATPESCRAEAESKNMNPKMLAAFKDGTKTMVEMAAVSNATGLVPDVPGMHGGKVELADLSKVLVPKEDGGILTHRGCVEYSTGKVAPGVFVIATSPDPRIREDLQFVSMGKGPYYLFYRPYHLCNIETPLTIAEAVLYGESTLVAETMVSEVVAVAKRDLPTGTVLSEIGGNDIYHTIYRYEESQRLRAVPMGLGTGARLTRAVKRDVLLTMNDVEPDRSRLAWKLRAMQDEFLVGGGG
jgi:predicted homoserine dehydrogenase-like protein